MTDVQELLSDSLRWQRRSSLVTFVSGVLTFALVWGQHHWQVLHPHYLDHPREDADAMDRHLAAMETMLGGSLRGKVFWIRGPLPKLGLDGLSTHGLALGSNTSPADWPSYVGLDRHELAHAALDQFRTPGADPP